MAAHSSQMPYGQTDDEAVDVSPFKSLFTVPYTEYTGPRGAGSTSRPQSLWCFTSDGKPGVSLWTALQRRPTGLDQANDLFFEGGPSKLRFRIAVPLYEPYYEQKNVYRVRRGFRTGITRNDVVIRTAEVVSRFVDKAMTIRTTEDQLRFGPGYTEFKDLYLLELRQCGSTLQVILARSVTLESSTAIFAPTFLSF